MSDRGEDRIIELLEQAVKLLQELADAEPWVPLTPPVCGKPIENFKGTTCDRPVGHDGDCSNVVFSVAP